MVNIFKKPKTRGQCNLRHFSSSNHRYQQHYNSSQSLSRNFLLLSILFTVLITIFDGFGIIGISVASATSLSSSSSSSSGNGTVSTVVTLPSLKSLNYSATSAQKKSVESQTTESSITSFSGVVPVIDFDATKKQLKTNFIIPDDQIAAAKRFDNNFLNVSGKLGTSLGLSSFEAQCQEKQFRCGNNDCIPIRLVCDNEPDCADQSDEFVEGCNQLDKTCGPDQFRCTNGYCIPLKWRCDQEKDCSDGSDEEENICIKNCTEDQFKCRTSSICILRTFVCDRDYDCPDLSDELNCPEQRTCSPEEFSCKSGEGECIPLAWMCDQNKDCSDGSDEASCNETCRSDEFTCANGNCIQKRWVCDRDNDCSDGSDERDCPITQCNVKTDFTCTDGACISKRWVCDGDNDCPDGSDEKDCANTPQLPSPCVAKEYQCNDRVTCIHRTWLCDGEKDCPNGDDEMPPQCQNITCRADQFRCDDRTCIPGNLICNGVADCADKSDERDCGKVNITECNKQTQFDCGGGMCIPMTKVCDKIKDCPDGEDEPYGKCGVNECEISNGGCSNICVDTPIGYYCDCPSGFKLVNKTTCEDINECEIPGACSQTCINEIGTFKCECDSGYMRDPRNHTRCKATEGHASLLFARRHDIRKIALDHHEMTSIVNDTKSATALDYVFRTGMIFWSDVSTQRIYKAPIDEGNDKTVVVKEHSVTSDGLAVDWIYSHIYFTDTQKCTIEITNFDGNMGKVLIEDQLEIPRAIALDPIEGWMYWTDWGASPKIERAGMDGTQRQAIVTFDVKWPNGLTLDLIKRRVYWVDAKLNTISSCNYDGTDRRLILYSSESLRHPFSITTFEDYIYWTDWDKQTVFKANKFNGDGIEPITALHMLQHPMTIHVYHPYRQPDGLNYCQSVNGHCSHLCLPAPRINERSPRISCACPTGLKLMEDGLMCVEDTTKTTVAPSRKTTMRPKPASTSRNASLPKSSHVNKDPNEGKKKKPIKPISNKTFSSNTIETHQSITDYPTSGTRPSGSNTTHPDGTIVHPQQQDTGYVALIVIGSLAATFVVLGVLTYLGYRHCSRRTLTSINFDNPVYRKTTEDQFSLEKNMPPRMYPSTVDDEAQEPLTKIGTESV